ncbi:MAG: hypothetical protein U1U88_001755 [Lawsonella clevelandensis]
MPAALWGRRHHPGSAANPPAICRLSVLLHSEWRARQLRDLAQFVDCAVTVDTPAERSWLVRMEGPVLLPVAQAWTKGAVKTVPARWTLSDRALQVWATVAGTLEENGMRFGLDPVLPAMNSSASELQQRWRSWVQRPPMSAPEQVGRPYGSPANVVWGTS